MGIAGVDLSKDGGKTWTPVTLGEDRGKYSFREWSARVALDRGEHVLIARAKSKTGETQPLTASWNPPGYMRNVADPVRVIAA